MYSEVTSECGGTRIEHFFSRKNACTEEYIFSKKLLDFVGMERLELSQIALYAPEAYVYTNFTTCPINSSLKKKRHTKAKKKCLI